MNKRSFKSREKSKSPFPEPKRIQVAKGTVKAIECLGYGKYKLTLLIGKPEINLLDKDVILDIEDYEPW